MVISFQRMRNILKMLEDASIGGIITASTGGELVLEPVGQPPQHLDRRLRSQGFVLVDCSYVFRPPTGDES